MLFDVALVSVVAGLLCLDRRAVGQTMLSQPIVSISLLGLLFGELELCLMIGALLQLFWMSANLYGANVPNNDTIASVTAVGAMLILRKVNPDVHESFWVVAVMVTMPSADLGRRLQGVLDGYNSRFSATVVKKTEGAEPVSLFRYVVGSMVLTFVAYTLLAFLVTGLCFAVLYYVGELFGSDLASATDLIAWFVLPALALAVSLSMIRRRLHLALSVLSFVVLGLVFQSMGLIL